jgi:DUF971 family protein
MPIRYDACRHSPVEAGVSTPVEIEKRGDRDVRIAWDDGHVSVYGNRDLRFACSCASCVDEWTGERRLQRAAVADDITLVDLQLVGNYALHITWSDGHSTGIYTWESLRRLCACADCTARRGLDGGS